MQLDPYRAMIAARHLRQNEGRAHTIDYAYRGEDIVEPPTSISLSAIGPPRVLLRHAGVEMAKCVHKARLNEPVYPFAFLRQETRPSRVRRWVCQVYLPVRCVQVAAEDDMPSLRQQSSALVQACFVKRHLEREPFVAAVAVRDVAVDKREARVLCDDGSSLGVAAAIVESKPDCLWLGTREQRRAAVAGPRGMVPIESVPRRRYERRLELLLGYADLLQTQDVWSSLADPTRKPAPRCRSDAVYIERSEQQAPPCGFGVG